MPSKLRWGIISTGSIAKTFARGLAASKSGTLAAVASRVPGPAETFAREFSADRFHDSYEALLADAGVEAIYLATPHPFHVEWAVNALNAGKHLLCEKPIAMNLRETQAMIGAAKKNDRLLMEAFMYRCHPQTAKAIELIRNDTIGTVLGIEAEFCFRAQFNPASRLFARDLGGGGILDVGCYTASMTRLLAGAATGLPFAEPSELKATGILSNVTGVDIYSSATARFPGDILAKLTCGVYFNPTSGVRVLGSNGSFVVPNPFTPSGPTKIVLSRRDREPETIEMPAAPDLYSLEADAFADALSRGLRAAPQMSPEDSLGNMALLDRWREEIGLRYAADEAS